MDPSIPQALDAVFPVQVGEKVFLTCRGHRHRVFNPARVRWWAWLYPDGKVLVNATALDDRGNNAEVWCDSDGAATLPEWCPGPPPWFRNTVATMGYEGPFPTHA